MASESSANEGPRGAKLGRKFAFVFLALGFLALNAAASDIKLKNGTSYTNVTILDQNNTQISLQTRFGLIAVPVSAVASIDGVPLSPPATPPPAAPSLLMPRASPVPEAPAAVHHEEERPAPAPTEAPSPAPEAAAASAGRPYEHDWRMEILLFVCAAAAFAWLFTMVRVQVVLRKRGSKEIGWNVLPFLLPGLGFLIFNVFGRSPWKRPARTAIISSQELAGRPPPPKWQKEASKERGSEPDSSLKFVREGVVVGAPKENVDGSGIQTARQLLEEAVAARTSDVHIEPQENEYRVRFRIDGVLEERAVLEKLDGVRVVSALKTLGEIDVAEKRKAQDGRFRARIESRDVDMRISTANSIFGEKVVIRILDRKGGIRGLAELGMSQEMVGQFNNAIHSRSGMILATGPTGAGKTSTLYAAISELDRKRRNVMTIEDPVECELDGATQIPVNVKAGVTYESGLRSILRQDPDVILVGEMRDAEAAKIAMRAAMTGTLVFSSLHTKDTINTILRLADMGVEPAQMASALLMLIAQRLVRLLCPECREPYACSGEELFDIGIELPAGETIYRAKGCPACSHTGYHGRTGIFELFVFDDEIREAIARQCGQEELLALVREKGFSGYREAGARNILLGITSVDEVLKAS